VREKESEITRLFRSAAQVWDDFAPEAPFGFDTRVVALWRAGESSGLESGQLVRLIRRVSLVATAVVVLAAAGAYLELNQNEELAEPSTNQYAMVDSALQNALLR
jgi:hypothetical protein